MTEYTTFAEMISALTAEGFATFVLDGMQVYPAQWRYRAFDEQWQMRELGVWSPDEQCWLHLGAAKRI